MSDDEITAEPYGKATTGIGNTVFIGTAAAAQADRALSSDMDDLETTIAALIDRKRDLDEASAEYRFINRQLAGLRYTLEEAGGIIEDLDPFGWHKTCRSAL